MELPSRLLNEAVNSFAKLPGIGNRTALRLVLYLLKQKPDLILNFSDSVRHLAAEIQYCRVCHNISDSDRCAICSDPSRDQSVLCVVQDIRDVIAIENTRQFRGVYHVLGGIISPVDGFGPSDLNIETLLEKTSSGKISEVVLALSATMEGETTAFYMYRRLQGHDVRITSISRGIGIGDQLEYTDDVTLGRSIINRVPFESTLSSASGETSPKGGKEPVSAVKFQS